MKPRELHLDKGSDVITVPAPSAQASVKHCAKTAKNEWTQLVSCPYYKVWKLDLDGELAFEQSHPFLNMSVIEGSGILNSQVIKKGDHFILPSGCGKVQLEGEMELIASAVK